jgi:hypothetical protein
MWCKMPSIATAVYYLFPGVPSAFSKCTAALHRHQLLLLLLL